MIPTVIVVNEKGEPVNFNARKGKTVTPSDTEENIFTSLYVGTEGDLAVILADDDEILLHKNIQGFVPLSTKKILSTNTTADDIIGYPAKK